MRRKMAMKHLDEARTIWNEQVPSRGQAETVQGELLRSVEKLRWEAQTNGNINRDDQFELLAAFIETTLAGRRTGRCLTRPIPAFLARRARALPAHRGLDIGFAALCHCDGRPVRGSSPPPCLGASGGL